MTENMMHKNNSSGQLGLLPLDLAESNQNDRSGYQKCLHPVLQKVLAIILVILFAIGLYILILRYILLQTDDNIRRTDIIVVSGLPESTNLTVVRDDMEILFRVKNKSITTNFSSSIRKKRHAINQSIITDKNTKEDVIKFKNNQVQKARKIILEHDVLCNEKNHIEVCKNLVMKLKELTDKDISQNSLKHIDKGDSKIVKQIDTNKYAGSSMKRETIPVINEDRMLRSTKSVESRDNGLYGYLNPDHIAPTHAFPYHQDQPTRLTDACLLARLMKQYNYPHSQDLYDSPAVEPEHSAVPYSGYFTPVHPTYLQAREIESYKGKPHPQDVKIALFHLTSKPELTVTENTLVRVVECPLGTVSCTNGDTCINENQWCDGTVDCDDVSDESRCNCKERVDKARICDGYFDCPFGEDEMGCYGCNGNAFSCEDIDINSQSTCYTLEQRCNNMADCPNHKDELECSMLAPGLHTKPLLGISNTEGYLHRNFKGNWHAVCKNPYMWAHDACRRETGLMIRPPFIQMIPIDPMSKMSYISTGPGGLIHMSNNCMNSSAVYVTCPSPLCGTRVSTSQLTKEDAAIENHMFGRNKRFLLTKYPYPLMMYPGRAERYVRNSYRPNILKNIGHYDEAINNLKEFEDLRRKRAESRVVGGRPSHPAAWPWMVALYRDGVFHCGGVIISQSWVMSAAHCVHKFWQYYYEVRVGMLRRFSFSPQERNHRVTHIIVNQNYNQEVMKDDLSLLRVKPAIQFSRWIRPICLPSPDTAGADWMWGPAPDTMCTAVGWGATVEHGPDPDHLREVEVPVWENCKHREDQAGKEICAGLVEGGKDACQGDSGGPLLCRNPMNTQQWYIAGIVSHGDGCGRKDAPGVYTRVSLFVDWIKYHTSSKVLPVIQPKQECPGYRCESGISKCLPKKRMCDKTIDCLNAEDEINCEVNRAYDENNDNMFLPTLTDEIFSNKNTELRDTETDQNFTIKTTTTSKFKDNVVFTTNTPVKMESFANTPLSLSTNLADESLALNDKRSTDKQINKVDATNNNEDFMKDFIHASTIELPNSESSENEENLDMTEDPKNLSNSEEVDTQTINLSASNDLLPSMSSISARTAEINEKGKEINIDEGWLNFNVTDKSTTEFTPTMITEGEFPEHDVIVTEINTHRTTNLNKIKQDTTEDVRKAKPDTKNNQNEEKSSNENIIQLLPSATTIPESVDKTIENNLSDLQDKNIPNKDVVTDDVTVQNISKLNTPHGNINKIEDFLQNELEPAKIRKKHLVPQDFQCQRINQTVPYDLRCDHKADCEDGTDEMDCTCMDYLTTFDKNLICDGSYDCANGQDESDCFDCDEEQFLCKRSQICISTKLVCDGQSQCPQGEDELDCFSLSNGKDIIYEFDGRPKVNLEGFLTKKRNDEWHVVCEDNISIPEQNQAAAHICRYLGFSSANRYLIKYVNLKENLLHTVHEDNRIKRDVKDKSPIYFTYKEDKDDNEKARHIVIKEPELIKEQCVPNITKTCMSLYVFCDHGLYNPYEVSQELLYRETDSLSTYTWPWIAKIYVDGYYKCTGVLIDVSWVLIDQSCLHDSVLTHNYVTVSLGSHKTLRSTHGPYEQVRKVDAKKDLYHSKVTILHLTEEVEYSNMVKPMVVTASYISDKNTTCVAIGQDYANNTVSLFLKETTKDCNFNKRCFVLQSNMSICEPGMKSHRAWSGIVSCHTKQGWHPSAAFVDKRGECGINDNIVGGDIGNLKHEINYYKEKLLTDFKEQNLVGDCEGIRCGRGRCMKLRDLCNGVRDCEDGNDESEKACEKKNELCKREPHYGGCECSAGELKCHNGRCVSKQLFKDGRDDCGDGTDEPVHTACSDYLRRVMPTRLCDGILHCHDRSDEDPMFCKCFAKQGFKCSKSSNNEDYCVAMDMVCDGVTDCPNGEDEATCVGLAAPTGTSVGSGKVIKCSHGVWYTKCYSSTNHTKSELESICHDLGFISGHAKQLDAPPKPISHPHNSVVLDGFNEVVFNNNTSIKLRNVNEPMATPIIDEQINCHPVYIECL